MLEKRVFPSENGNFEARPFDQTKFLKEKHSAQKTKVNQIKLKSYGNTSRTNPEHKSGHFRVTEEKHMPLYESCTFC